MTNDNATPRPWHRVADSNLIIKQSHRDYRIAKIEGGTGKITDDANAELIVRAVNNFDSLLEACKLALQHMEANNMLLKDNFLTKAITKATETK